MPQPEAKRRRRWYQFSLRALLIATAVAAGLAFAWVKCVEPYRLQRIAVAAITKLGGTYKSEDAVGWVRYLDKNAQNVLVVDLADCDAPDEYLQHLARLPKLRTLIIGGHSVGDEEVGTLVRFHNLKGLVLDSTLVTDDGIDTLKEKLPDLVVYKSQHRAVAALEKVGAVEGMVPTIPPTWLCDDTEVGYFSLSPVRIELDGERLRDADLRWLNNLVDVRLMLLGRTGIRVNDETMVHIARCSNVRKLDLSGTDLSDEGMVHLAEVNKLEYLALSNTRITDAGLRHIAGMPRLQSVEASKTLVGNTGLGILVDLPTIESLSLPGTLVTDNGLHHLRRSKTLRRVWLDKTKVTDKGIRELAGCSQLTVLGIEKTDMSPRGVEQLRRALPMCRIEY